MSKLTLPDGADAGFQLAIWDAFGGRFTAHVYGARRDGWLVATRRDWAGAQSAVGPVSLVRPRWRDFLGLVRQAGFWELPASLPPEPDVIAEDGEWLSLAGRRGELYHEVHREGFGGPRLFQICRFVTRWSSLFTAPRPRPPTQDAELGETIATSETPFVPPFTDS